MKKMTLGNRILAMLLAFVMILTGIAPGTFNARVVKAADATEQRFNRIYREDGIVQVTNSIYQNSDSILTPKETSHRIKARKAGEVTDNSQVSDKVDIDQIVKEGITSASTFLNSQNYKYECSGASDWYIMSKLRTGQTISDAEKEAYGQSAVSVVSKWKANQKPTDIARVALTLSAMGKDITNVGGVNLAAMLYSSDRLEDGSNELSWTLIALDATSQKIPADAKWDRESMIDALLGFQNENGGFGLFDNKSTGVDMTAMILQALAPYVKEAKVQTAVDKALAYLKDAMDEEYAYTSPESAAQVILALACLKLDAVDAGFAAESKGIFSTLEKNYRVKDGGYAHLKNGVANAMASYQIMEAYEAYRRFKASEEGYWDMNSLKPSTPETPSTTETPNTPETPSTSETPGTPETPSTDKTPETPTTEKPAKKPARPVIRKAAAVKKKATLTWKKVKGAAGYQVYRSMRKNGKYVCVKKNLKAAKYTDKKLKKGKTYYYKVRAYKKVNGKTITGAYSAIRKVKVK